MEIGYKNNYETNFYATGPYNKGEGISGSSWYWSNLWYNSTIKYMKLDKIKIEYTDGTTVTIEGDDIALVTY